MKKIIIIGLTFFSVFIIYLANMDRKIYYLAFGDSQKTYLGKSGNEIKGYSFYVNKYLNNKDILERYIYQYSDEKDRITDLINYIKDNKEYKNNTLKNSLIKADLVTISISISDIFSKLDDDSVVYSDVYDYIDDLANDLSDLLRLIREYCKEDIVFIGYFNPYDDDDISDIVNYLNKKYKDVCNDYNVSYVDISNMDKKYINDGQVTKEGIKFISQMVINTVDKILFEG